MLKALFMKIKMMIIDNCVDYSYSLNFKTIQLISGKISIWRGSYKYVEL
jgi:hypothetical protein